MLEFRKRSVPAGTQRMTLFELHNANRRFRQNVSGNACVTLAVAVVLSASLVTFGTCRESADGHDKLGSTSGTLSFTREISSKKLDSGPRTSRQMLLRDVFRSSSCMSKYFCMLSAQKPSNSSSSWNDMLNMLRFAMVKNEDSDEENYRVGDMPSKAYHHRTGSEKRKHDTVDIDELLNILRPKIEKRKSEGSKQIEKKEGLLLDDAKESTFSKIVSKVTNIFRTGRSSSLWKNREFWKQMEFAARIGQDRDTSGEVYEGYRRQERKCSSTFKRCPLSFDAMKQIIEEEPWIRGTTTNRVFENAAEFSDWRNKDDLKTNVLKSRTVKRTPMMEDDELEELVSRNRKEGKFGSRHDPEKKESSEENKSEDAEHHQSNEYPPPPTVPEFLQSKQPPFLPVPRPTPVLYDYKPIFPWITSIFGSKKSPLRPSVHTEQGFGKERPIRIKNAFRPRLPGMRPRPQRPEMKGPPSMPPQQIWTHETVDEKRSSEETSQSSEERDVAEVELDTPPEIEKQWEGVVAKDIEVYLKTTTQAPIITTTSTTTRPRTTTTARTTTGSYQDNLKKVVDDVVKTSFPNDTSLHMKSELRQLVGSLLQNNLTPTPLTAEQEMQAQFLALLQQLQENQRHKMAKPPPTRNTFPFLGSSGFVHGPDYNNPYAVYQNQFTNQGPNSNNYFNHGHQNSYGPPHQRGSLPQFSFYQPQNQAPYPPPPQGFQQGGPDYPPPWVGGFSEQELLEQYLPHNAGGPLKRKLMVGKSKVVKAKPTRGGVRRKSPEVPEDEEDVMSEQQRVQLETAKQLHRLAQEQLSLARKQSLQRSI